MPAKDPVEAETPVFTERNVYEIVGFVLGRITDDLDEEEGVAVTEEAIQYVLSNDQR